MYWKLIAISSSSQVLVEGDKVTCLISGGDIKLLLLMVTVSYVKHVNAMLSALMLKMTKNKVQSTYCYIYGVGAVWVGVGWDLK